MNRIALALSGLVIARPWIMSTSRRAEHNLGHSMSVNAGKQSLDLGGALSMKDRLEIHPLSTGPSKESTHRVFIRSENRAGYGSWTLCRGFE